jgi:hypothetical protein
MREDFMLVPEVFRIDRRTMRVVRGDMAFTALYNLAGLALAATGVLPAGSRDSREIAAPPPSALSLGGTAAAYRTSSREPVAPAGPLRSATLSGLGSGLADHRAAE